MPWGPYLPHPSPFPEYRDSVPVFQQNFSHIKKCPRLETSFLEDIGEGEGNSLVFRLQEDKKEEEDRMWVSKRSGLGE